MAGSVGETQTTRVEAFTEPSTNNMKGVVLDPVIEGALMSVVGLNAGNLTPLTNLKKILSRLMNDPSNDILRRMRRDVLARMLHSEETLELLLPVLQFVGFQLSENGDVFHYTASASPTKDREAVAVGISASSVHSNALVPVVPVVGTSSSRSTTTLAGSMSSSGAVDHEAIAASAENAEAVRELLGDLDQNHVRPRDADDPLLKLEIADDLFLGVDMGMEAEPEADVSSSGAATGTCFPAMGGDGNELKQVVLWIESLEVRDRAPEQFSFAEVMHFVQNDMTLPGIKKVEDDPEEPVAASSPTMERPTKPWEKR